MAMADDLWLGATVARQHVLHLMQYNAAFYNAAAIQTWRLGIEIPGTFLSALARSNGFVPAELAPVPKPKTALKAKVKAAPKPKSKPAAKATVTPKAEPKLKVVSEATSGPVVNAAPKAAKPVPVAPAKATAPSPKTDAPNTAIPPKAAEAAPAAQAKAAKKPVATPANSAPPAPAKPKAVATPKTKPAAKTPVKAAAKPVPKEKAKAKPAPKAKAEPKPAAPAPVEALSGPSPHLLDAPRGGKADELTSLSGVGEKLATALNEFGIYHFDQIASLDETGIDWLNEQQPGFKALCKRFDLVNQAKGRGA